MKKLVGFLAVTFVVLAVGAFLFQSKINDQINSKISELNNNGFIVKYEQSTNYIKTTAKGEIEISEPDKVFSYILADIKNQEFKKALEVQYSFLDSNQKGSFFEGIKFDYDFVVGNFNGKVDSNLYLTNFSKKMMYNLSQDAENETSKWLLSFLKDRKLQVNINEKKEYKVIDIDTVIPNEVFIAIKGFKGNDKNIQIPLIKFSGVGVFEKEFVALNNLNVDFEINENKQNSKTSIGNIEYQLSDAFLNIKNLIMNSNYERNDKVINTQSEISFDEVVVKAYDKETMNLKNSSLKFNFNNLPAKNVEEVAQYFKDLKYDEYLETLTQNGTTLHSFGNASNYVIANQKIFDTLKYDLSLSINKNGTIIEAKKINDIFDNFTLTIDVDKQTAEQLKALSNLREKEGFEIDFIDTADNLKRFEAVLKNDGIYVNNKKIVEENELLLPAKEEPESFDDTPLQKIDSKSLTYTYKEIGDNLLKLDIKYNTNLKAISSGGISVSFPQLSDATRIVKNETKTFKKIELYNLGSEIWNGALQKDIASSYLLVEAWDNEWKNSEDEKEISLIIDVKDLDVLEVYLRAGALNEKDETQPASEIVPFGTENNFTEEYDQQGYPVIFIEIPVFKNR